jgi:hypothetical protein
VGSLVASDVRRYCFASLGLIGFAFLPTAYAMGCILTPPRG